MILAKVREVWERKVLDYIEPTHALIIRDNVYLSVAASCIAEKDSQVKEAATVPYTIPLFTSSNEGRPGGRVDK